MMIIFKMTYFLFMYLMFHEHLLWAGVCHMLGIKDKQCLVPVLKEDLGSH